MSTLNLLKKEANSLREKLARVEAAIHALTLPTKVQQSRKSKRGKGAASYGLVRKRLLEITSPPSGCSRQEIRDGLVGLSSHPDSAIASAVSVGLIVSSGERGSLRFHAAAKAAEAAE